MAKNILVFGGTGFVGKNIFAADNYIYDSNVNYYFISSKNTLPFDSPNLFLLKYNCFDEQQLNYIFRNYTFDEVWHFLSSTVPSTSQNLLEFSIQNDLLYLIKLLDHMNNNNVRKIVFLSSGGTVYSGNSVINSQEDLITTPTNPYGILKTTMEHFIKYYHQHFGLNYSIIRISNLFGPYHYNENNGIINVSIRKALNGDILNIVGNGSITKDFLFVSDFAKIYWSIISSKDTINSIINVGSGFLFSINDILSILKKKLPQLSVNYILTKKIDNSFSDFSINKLKGIIQLNLTNFETALDKTIHWEYQNIKNKAV
jgi:UDP-glucose 4-epimerase